MAYAKDTNIRIEQTKADIESLLSKRGAKTFSYASSSTLAEITFTMRERLIRYRLRMPDEKADEFQLTPGRRWRRSPEEARKAYLQGCKARWRSLYLVILAKLEAVAAGITSFEAEFLAHIVLPSDRTVVEELEAPIAEAYRTGKMPSAAPLMIGQTVDAEVVHEAGR